jgi:hypothetical protein
VRTSARTTGAVAAMAVAALLVSGCGSSGDKGGKGDKADKGGGKEKETPTSPAPSADEKKGSLPGVWQTTAGGEKLVLVIAQKKATLFHGKGGKKACTGSVLGEPATLTLKCPNGVNAERTNGTVEKVEAKTLTVSWNGGAKDDYTKAAEAPKFLPKDPEKIRKLIPAG